MNKSVLLYPILSFLTFYIIQISSQTNFAFFGIFLYIASGVALLVYLESIDRTRKTDFISFVIYILFAVILFLLYTNSSYIAKTGFTLNDANKIWWMPLYIIAIFLPIYILYKNRANGNPLYIPVIFVAFFPAILVGAILFLLPNIRHEAISMIANIIQVGIIDTLIKMKETMQIPDSYADMLSYLILNKESIAKQIIYMMPAAHAYLFVLIIYMCDRMKPIFKDNLLSIREYRLPDNLVWVLICGGFLILAPNESLKYVSYNVIAIFALLYFLQGLQFVNKLFDRFKVSIFVRSLLFFFIFLYFTIFVSMIVLMGIFSIWYKPKWLETDNNKNKDIEDDKQ